jgi:parallel beta-helix repeat protein
MAIFDVSDYGAVADGVTDARPHIQAALDAAGLAGGTNTVVIPAGTYFLSNMLVVPSNVTLQGVGAATVLVTPPGDLPGVNFDGVWHFGVIGLIGVTDAAVKNLSIDMETNNTHANGIIMATDGLGNVTTGSHIEGVYIEGNNSHQYLIWNFNAQNTTIINNTLDGNVTSGAASEQEGIEVFGGQNVLIQSNTLTDIGSNAIYAWEDVTIPSPFSGIDIIGNTVIRGKQGIFVVPYTTASDINITGNSTDGQFGRGIFIASANGTTLSNVLVDGNTITNAAEIGIWLSDQGASWNDVVVTNNNVQHVTGRSSSTGIRVDAENVEITNNAVSDVNYAGIYFANASNSSATGNVITDARTLPLYVETYNSTNVVFSDNEGVLQSSSGASATIVLGDTEIDATGQSTTITIIFNTIIPGFEADNVVLPSGVSVSSLTSTNGGRTWTGTLTVADNVFISAGTVQLTLVDVLVNLSGTPYLISATASFVANTYDGVVLTAGDGGESLVGGIGNDTLIGGTSNDTLNGGLGSDSMSGGAGNDAYHVDASGDLTIEQAGQGDDTAIASVSWTLGAGQAVETLRVNTSNASAITLTGNDLANNFYGRAAGADTLIGAGGNDRLFDQGGASTLNGGGGDDFFFVTNTGTRVIEANGGGSDSLYVTVNYTLAAEQAIEYINLYSSGGLNVAGNEFDNWIDGGGGNDTINGGNGNDYITGGNGNDSLVGGAGNDRMLGGSGTNTMIGGAGNDTFFVASTTDIVSEATGGGSDTVLASISWTLGAGQSVEFLQVAAATVGSIALAGNELANTLYGRAAGGDTLDAGGGNDRLFDLGGATTMIGGSGDDFIMLSNAGSAAFEAVGGGADSLYVTVSYSLTAGQEIEYVNLYSSSGLSVAGNEFANWIDGGVGNDTIDGGSGNDYLVGGAGNDVIVGGFGNDKIEGLLGDGDDTFVFANTWGNDIVLGFDNDHDTLDLTQVSGLDNVSQLTIATLYDSSLLISYGNDSIRLIGNVNAITILDDIIVA